MSDLKPISEPSKRSQLSTISNSKYSAPSSFQLLNHTIKTKETPALKEVGDYYGQAEYDKDTIHMCPGLSEHVKHHTFCHELIHFILHYAGRDDLAGDEQLVDVLGGLLAQYEATKRP